MNIYVNTLERGLTCYAVSVTTVKNSGLVLRFGAELGKLLTLVGKSLPENTKFIVPRKGYNAQSSAGFVQVNSFPSKEFTEKIIGMLGMPFQKNREKIQILGVPEEVYFFSATGVKRLDTHGNSNAASANAAFEAIQFMGANSPLELYISEGQSDYVAGFRISGLAEAWAEEEFRQELFSAKNLAKSFLQRICRSEHEQVFAALVCCALCVADKNLFSDRLKVAEKITNLNLEKGWDNLPLGGFNLIPDFRNKGINWEVERLPFECRIRIVIPEKGTQSFSFSLLGDEINHYSSFYWVDDFLFSFSYEDENKRIEHESARRGEMLNLTLSTFGSDEWGQKEKLAFEQAESFIFGILEEIQDGEEKIYLLRQTGSGKTMKESLSYIERFSDLNEKVCIAATGCDGNITASRVAQRNWDNSSETNTGFGYNRGYRNMKVLHPTQYKNKIQKVSKIITLLESFGKVSCSQFGNRRRSHYATYVADDSGITIAGLYCNGSDYVTPSLQSVASLDPEKDLGHWFLSEPFDIKIAYDTRDDIKKALLLIGEELKIEMATNAFSIKQN